MCYTSWDDIYREVVKYIFLEADLLKSNLSSTGVKVLLGQKLSELTLV